MTINILLIALVAAILSVLLGFIALISQKIYVDAQKKSLTEVNVPILGRMRTNYPSLIFVFLGFSLMFYVLGNLPPKLVDWEISGQFFTDDQDIVWSASNLELFPCAVETIVDKDTGRFKINLKLEEGRTFEDVFQGISYADKRASISIIPGEELEKYRKDKSSLLSAETQNRRVYKAVKLENMPF